MILVGVGFPAQERLMSRLSPHLGHAVLIARVAASTSASWAAASAAPPGPCGGSAWSGSGACFASRGGSAGSSPSPDSSWPCSARHAAASKTPQSDGRNGRVPRMLSVIVPAFNEARRLPATLQALRVYLDGAGEEYEEYEVIVVDDGSRDGTAQLAEQTAAGWEQLQVIRLPQNRGKGAAVRAGMLAARGQLRLFTDADLSTPSPSCPSCAS